MAQKERKVNKKRGSRTHGYGNAQKHRGAGSRGGRGKAGGKKQKWSFVSKNLPGYFGGSGFKRPQRVLRTNELNKINLKDIEEKFSSLLKEGLIKEDKGSKKFKLNLTELGYDKLLGSGKVTHPLLIKVDSYSQKAKVKVKELGGKIESGIPEADT